MSQYFYALSIVSRSGDSINNGLYSGVAEVFNIFQIIRNIPYSYDLAFARSVSIITCNIAEQGGSREFTFRRSYTFGELSTCLEDIIADISGMLESYSY